MADLWQYALGREDRPFDSAAEGGATVTVKPTPDYKKELNAWIIGYEKALARIRLSCESGPRTHFKNTENSYEALEIPKKSYGVRDLATVDIAFQEITRSNLSDHANIEACG